MNKLYLALIANLIASVFAFFQIQGHYVWDKPWLKSIWFIYGTSMFIAPLYWYSTKWSFEHFGALWNMRLAGFGLSTLTFGLLTWWLIGEVPNIKTTISLVLAVSIILIQISNI
tara:strand:+ start:366 stop:707 length:342 start_codon:yes stop_codon:yes gene_type:complete